MYNLDFIVPQRKTHKRKRDASSEDEEEEFDEDY